MTERTPVVVIGTGLACALGNSVELAGAALRRGELPQTTLDIDWFESQMRMPWFGIDCSHSCDSPERFSYILNSVVTEALVCAGLDSDAAASMGIFLGSSSFEVGVSELRYRNDIQSQGQHGAMPMPLVSLGNLSGRIRRQFEIYGPDFVYGTACSASTNALLGATRMISSGIIEHALVIGVELHNLTTLAGFQSLQLISDDRIRPFDNDRSGMILGEACAAVVLSASSDRNSIARAKLQILGGASQCDTGSVTAPSSDGVAIADVMSAALSDAGLNWTDVDLIKAHGTASPANDTAEAAGLHRLFKEVPALFSLKPYIGHTLGASGVAELVLFETMLRARQVPATAGFERVDPELNIVPVKSSTPMNSEIIHLINCFGFGGNNTVLVTGFG